MHCTVRSQRITLAAIALSLAVAWQTSEVPAAGSEKQTTRYFEQLRRRGLLQIAEGVCRRELARDDLTPESRSQYTLELSRTLTEQAKYAVGRSQDGLWKQAAGVVDEHLKSSPKAPRGDWLRLQGCITLVLHGEFLRWDAELVPSDDAVRRRALAVLKTAIDQLRKLDQSTSSGASAGERRELRTHIRYQQAIAYLNLAELFTGGSTERKGALRQASAALSPLAVPSPASVLEWNSHVLSARALRLEGDLRRATDRLSRVQKQKPPAEVRLRIEIELVRILLAKGLHKQADAILRTLQNRRQSLPGELAFLKLKTLTALWNEARKAGDAERAASLLKQAEDAVALAERTVGGYWSYRCRVLLGFLKDARQHGPEVAVALRKAQTSFEAKQWTTAAGEYLTAAGLAAKAGDEKLAARLTFTAGSIHLQAKDYESAARDFRRLVKDHPRDSRAAEADLMAAYCLGRSYDSLRTKSRRLAYADALKEHRRRFPKSPTVHEAAWMLATLHEYRGQTTDALKLYLAIPATHARGSAAQLAAARSYETVIARLRDLKKPADRIAWERHASARLGEIIATFPKPPKTWNAAQTELALRTARIELQRTPAQHATAEPLLERVIASADSALNTSQGSPKNPGMSATHPFWAAARGGARQLRIVSLAGTGRFDDAQTLLADLQKAGPGEVLVVLDGLMHITTDSTDVREKLGDLQLRTAQELHRNRGTLKPAEQKWLDRCLAQALESTGQGGQAAAVYEQLLAKSPRDRALLTKVATLLGDSTDRESLRKARRHWQTLQSFDKPGTVGWLTARYEIARCEFRLGNAAECRKLLSVTRLLYPELGGAKLRKQYESLGQQLNRKRSSPRE